MTDKKTGPKTVKVDKYVKEDNTKVKEHNRSKPSKNKK